MDPFGTKAVCIATMSCSLLALRAVRKKSLTQFGAIAGFITGWCMVCTGLRGLVLFYFYQVGSWATKYKQHIKMQRDATATTHANRGAVQVLCVSILACLLSLYQAYTFGREQSIDFTNHYQASCVALALTAHHATGLADTLASELGILASTPPFNKWLFQLSDTVLVTQPWRRVPPGTNGGITLIGCVWSAVGGCIIGVLTLGMDALSGLQPHQYAMPFVLYATMIGLIGSLLDSLLGALLQATYYDSETKKVHHAQNASCSLLHVCGMDILTNEQVNLASTALTMLLGGWILGPLFF